MPIDPDFYDNELRRHDVHFRGMADVRAGDRVLDIGCGGGQTTCEAARAAVDGHALGVDVSAPMLDRARRRSIEEGVRNVVFELGDAATHPFAPAAFDLCISRFGTMFFADPVDGFVNIGRGLRPDARVVLLVWQAQHLNEWAVEIDRVITAGRPPASPAKPPSAFSLGDPAVTREILARAGFVDVEFTDVHEPVFYGTDVSTAHENVLSFARPKDFGDGADADRDDAMSSRLMDMLAAHHTGDGVLLDSRAWIVGARRP